MLSAKARTRIACVAVVAAFACGPAQAQTYPNGQVRLIVPTSPGGVTDTMARIVAQRLTETLGLTAIVDNRPAATAPSVPPPCSGRRPTGSRCW